MKQLKTTFFFFSFLFANFGYAQIAIDTYKDGERRIQTESYAYKGIHYFLDTYANELSKDTVYYLKIGISDIADSIVVGNRLLIKIAPQKEDTYDNDGNLVGYNTIGSDTTLTLNCCQVTKKRYNSIQYASASSFGSSSRAAAGMLSTTYQVEFYKIKKTDIETLTSRGTKVIRLETVNNVSDHKVSGLAKVIKKQYASILKQFAKPCLKQDIDNF